MSPPRFAGSIAVHRRPLVIFLMLVAAGDAVPG